MSAVLADAGIHALHLACFVVGQEIAGCEPGGQERTGQAGREVERGMQAQRAVEERGHRHLHAGRPCPDDFSYTSDRNDRWLSADEMRALIAPAEPVAAT